MNKNIKISKYILFVSGFTMISVIALVVQSGYSNLMKNDSSSKQDEINTIPLNTKLNTQVIEDIKKSKEYTSSDLQIIPTETVDPIASESADTNE